MAVPVSRGVGFTRSWEIVGTRHEAMRERSDHDRYNCLIGWRVKGVVPRVYRWMDELAKKKVYIYTYINKNWTFQNVKSRRLQEGDVFPLIGAGADQGSHKIALKINTLNARPNTPRGPCRSWIRYKAMSPLARTPDWVSTVKTPLQNHTLQTWNVRNPFLQLSFSHSNIDTITNFSRSAVSLHSQRIAKQ